MGIFSALRALCEGTGEFPSQRPVTWSFDVFFGLRLNKRLSKQSTLSNAYSWMKIYEFRLILLLKFVLKGPIHNIPTLLQIMACRRPGDKPLSEPLTVSLLAHICITLPQWVKTPEYRPCMYNTNHFNKVSQCKFLEQAFGIQMSHKTCEKYLAILCTPYLQIKRCNYICTPIVIFDFKIMSGVLTWTIELYNEPDFSRQLVLSVFHVRHKET